MAGAIAVLVESRLTVNDPETHETRAVEYGDIAVLAATNDHVETVAGALRERRVPMKMTLSGFLDVPEVCLARACRRRLNDPSDTLATAEIRALGACEQPEHWLADRLRWLAAGEDDRRWGEADDPIVSRIARLRGCALARADGQAVPGRSRRPGARLRCSPAGRDGLGTGRNQGRSAPAQLRRISRPRRHVTYEDRCATQHEAAILTGFLVWLEPPSSPEVDLRPVVTGGDAVHVLTYHRAKGLEWPVVVATEFHYTWGSRIREVRSRPGSGPLDIDDLSLDAAFASTAATCAPLEDSVYRGQGYWGAVQTMTRRVLVDGNNVMGSRPDGW